MISQATIERVKTESDLVEIVNEYVAQPLRRTGAQLSTLCPFHKERSPSFYVHPGKNSWHCKGCNEGGGPLQFLMRAANLDFPTAVRQLALRLGIDVETGEADSKAQYIAMLRREAMWAQAKVHRKYLDRETDAWYWGNFYDAINENDYAPEQAHRCYENARRWRRRIDRHWYGDGRPRNPDDILARWVRYRQRHPEAVNAYRLEMQLADECEAVERAALAMVPGLSEERFEGLLDVIGKRLR